MNLISVSYTHLDVYKRQCEESAWCEGSFVTALLSGEEWKAPFVSAESAPACLEESKGTLVRGSFSVGSGLKAVSYTHLDVYKRQNWTRRHSRRRTSSFRHFSNREKSTGACKEMHLSLIHICTVAPSKSRPTRNPRSVRMR